jgi:GT2 family glycosyltransferase
MRKTAVIIVTHNSQPVLLRCLTSLEQQTVPPDTVVLVDSGSVDHNYLRPYQDHAGITVFFENNIGFSRANNIGYASVAQDTDFILFLNPDAFPEPDSIELALAFFSDKDNRDVGCIGGRLSGFDCDSGESTGRLDSTGVFRKWYGCWHDRSQGEADNGQRMVREDVPAVCGAFFFCRKTMLEQVSLIRGENKDVFDPDFFLYKEDIELCLRMRKAGWRIVYLPEIVVRHCRGWQKDRRLIPHQLRLTAAASELLLYRKHPSLYMLWALIKYLLVRWLRL